MRNLFLLRRCFVLCILLTWHNGVYSFGNVLSQVLITSFSPTQPRHRLQEKNDDSEETYTLGNNDLISPIKELDDLTPPPINVPRSPILFSENPSTRRNNDFLKLWRFCKESLPPVITGAWSWKDPDIADDNPIGGLYNIAFVRAPVILVGFGYGKNLLEGHPLIMDIGDGPFVMSPVVVILILGLILA